MYSEYLGSVGLAKDFDKLWVPEDANIDTYFKAGNGRVVIPQKADDGTTIRNIKTVTDVGNATAITVNTEGKAIDRVSVSYATEEEIIAAAKAAQAHDFIMELPDGSRAEELKLQ